MVALPQVRAFWCNLERGLKMVTSLGLGGKKNHQLPFASYFIHVATSLACGPPAFLGHCNG